MRIETTDTPVGAFVRDVDLRSTSDEEMAALIDAWADHGVLFFRDQELTPEEHVAFAERIAPIDINRFFTPVDGHPKVAQVLKEADQITNIGGGWHTDHSYDQIPARGSILLALETPPSGGDTMFMSAGAAFEALSEGMRDMLRGLRAHHSNEHIFGAGTKHMKDVGGRVEANADGLGSAEHPVVIKHPHNGRELLYVNMAFTTHFVGWTVEESRPLLDQLWTHMAQDKFHYHFQWEPGSIAMWDNRSTWHSANNDYHGHRRLMHRITVSGEPLS